MALTREDMLRELELLPVWQLRQPVPVTEPKGAPSPQQAIEKEAQKPQVQEATPVVDKLAIPWVLVYQLTEEQQQAGQVLLQNIIKAMRLPQDEVVTLTQDSQVETYQATSVILFGQTSVDMILKGATQSVESLRGQGVDVPNTKTQYWVTYGLAEMLENPSLKAAVWQDIKAAMQAAR